MQQVDVEPATKPYFVVHAVTIPRNGALQLILLDWDLVGISLPHYLLALLNKSWWLTILCNASPLQTRTH